MAVGAFAGVMGERRVLAVARFAFGDVGMVIAERLPGDGVCVAALAVARIMGGGNGRFRIVDQHDFWHNA